ncbi:MAG TPA: Gfo/Idh/MocA family oxidoreductase [Bdellovibrionota bacterium]|nr:Gfo/Idh/MocA family oxidoreductase [Bdellovibrionota bacterium]
MTTGERIRAGLVGYGYWGPNLLRNLVSHGGVDVVGVIESKADARAKCSALYPHIPVFASLEDFFRKGGADAMVIATPPATHRELAIRCLEAGAHVLVEKPLALSTAECDDILRAAEKAGRQVMVDHTFVFHPAVEYLASSIKRGDLGDLLYYDSVRVNLGGFQANANALWDLAPHDLSILDSFLGGKSPYEVSAVGIRHFGTSVENLCYLTLRYENQLIAHINLNWVAPVKIRTITVGGSKKMAIYDDNLPTEKIKIYDKSVSLSSVDEKDFRVNYRIGDMTAPAISAHEALRSVISHFVDCVRKGTRPICDGVVGRRVVEILEAASISLSEGGRPVTIGGGAVERRGRRNKAAA